MSSHVANDIQALENDPLSAGEIAELADRASAIFDGEVAVERSVDPEYPAAVYLVFRVVLREPRPSTDEIIDRELQWGRKAAEIAPSASGIIRLFIE